jgi:hypothetical protein
MAITPRRTKVNPHGALLCLKTELWCGKLWCGSSAAYICAMRSSSSLVFLAPGLAPTSTGRPVNWWYGPAKLWKQNRRIPQPAGLTGTARHHDFRFSKPPPSASRPRLRHSKITSPSQQNQIVPSALDGNKMRIGHGMVTALVTQLQPRCRITSSLRQREPGRSRVVDCS